MKFSLVSIVLSATSIAQTRAFIRDGSTNGFIQATGQGLEDIHDAVYGGSSPENMREAYERIKNASRSANEGMRESPSDFTKIAKDEFQNRYSATRDATAAMRSAMIDELPPIANNFEDTIQNHYDSAVEKIQSVPRNVPDLRENANLSYEELQLKYEQLKEQLNNITSGVPETRENAQNTYTQIRSNIDTTVNQIPSNVQEAYQNIHSRSENVTIPGIPESRENISNMYNNMRSTGGDIVSGAKNNVQDAYTNAQQAAETISATTREQLGESIPGIIQSVPDNFASIRDTDSEQAYDTKTRFKNILNKRKDSVTTSVSPADTMASNMSGQEFMMMRNLQENANLRNITSKIDEMYDKVKTDADDFSSVPVRERGENLRNRFRDGSQNMIDTVGMKVDNTVSNLEEAHVRVRDAAASAEDKFSRILFKNRNSDEAAEGEIPEGRRLQNFSNTSLFEAGELQEKLESVFSNLPQNITPGEMTQLENIRNKLYRIIGTNSDESGRRLSYNETVDENGNKVIDCPSCNAAEGTMGITSFSNTSDESDLLTTDDEKLLNKIISTSEGIDKSDRFKLLKSLGLGNFLSRKATRTPG